MAIAIINQPMDWYGAVGEMGAMWVDAEGDNLTYQWWVKRQGASSFSRSSVTGPLYFFTQPDVDNRPSRSLYCVVSDGVDSVTTNTVTAALGTMPPLKTQLCRIRLGVKNVCDAISAKGVTVPNGYAPLEDLPALIAQI